jgi:hypothetical protein
MPISARAATNARRSKVEITAAKKFASPGLDPGVHVFIGERREKKT